MSQNQSGWLSPSVLLVSLGMLLSAWGTWVTWELSAGKDERTKILAEWSMWRGTVTTQLNTLQTELKDIRREVNEVIGKILLVGYRGGQAIEIHEQAPAHLGEIFAS